MTLTREQMLAEMGITPLWVLRAGGDAETADAAEGSAGNRPALATPAATAASPQRESLAPGESDAHRGSPADQEAAAATTGAHLAAAKSLGDPASGTAPAATASDIAALDWDGVIEGIAACRACVLCQQRKQAVPGVGDLSPDWLFIGEGPGAEEDARGEPFVGQAGKLLDNMLAALDIARGRGVYIANAVKCRPPGNRTPEAGEMAACRPWLQRQIELLKPRVIVLLGKAAVHSLLHEDKPLGTLRGQRYEYAGIPVVVTYHPAYLLRNLPEKAKAWEDLVFARKLLREAQA